MICQPECKNIIWDDERYVCIDCGRIIQYKMYYNNFDVVDAIDNKSNDWTEKLKKRHKYKKLTYLNI
jgi:transcription initiation factor TFIIIB Brf1 subunit/transcription initiation factor TFIIB